MKRVLAVSVLSAALVAPGSGLASSDSYSTSAKAKGERPPAVDFIAIYVNGRPDEVKKFRFRRVVMTCAVGGQFKTKSEPPHFGPFNVNDEGRFGGVDRHAGPTGDVTVVIRGDFVAPHRVRGTLKINGDYGDGYEDCASGVVDWKAVVT